MARKSHGHLWKSRKSGPQNKDLNRDKTPQPTFGGGPNLESIVFGTSIAVTPASPTVSQRRRRPISGLCLEHNERKYQTLILDIGPGDTPGADNHYRISGGFYLIHVSVGPVCVSELSVAWATPLPANPS